MCDEGYTGANCGLCSAGFLSVVKDSRSSSVFTFLLPNITRIR
jgi:hypothetical protein